MSHPLVSEQLPEAVKREYDGEIIDADHAEQCPRADRSGVILAVCTDSADPKGPKNFGEKCHQASCQPIISPGTIAVNNLVN